jgi:ABC-2 type transport system permease protein
VITTALYFIVFGGAIGSHMQQIGGVDYGSFIVPGLIMLTLLTQSISNASIAIYFPKFTGTIFEILSAPLSASRMVVGLCRRGRDQVGRHRADHPGDRDLLREARDRASLLDARLPAADLASPSACSASSSASGPRNFEQLAIVPSLVVTPLTFLGGAFYSIDMLPQPWRTISLFNPVVYLVSGFRWSFHGTRAM